MALLGGAFGTRPSSVVDYFKVHNVKYTKYSTQKNLNKKMVILITIVSMIII